MNRRMKLFWRLPVAAALATAAAGALGPAAHADSSSSSSSGSSGSNTNVVGEAVTTEAIGAQFAFNIPNLIPLPNQNLVEEDLAFARSTVSTGPTVDSIGAPYYPGDILANLGGLESEFFPPQLPNTPYPFMARAQYPATPSYGATSTFAGGAGPAPGGTAAANVNGGNASGTVSDIVVGAGMGQGGAPLLEFAAMQSQESATIATSSITGTATSVVKAIEVAGMVDITQVTSSAQSTSDGSNGQPSASVKLGQVTVDGQQAYIDNQGVHVAGNGTSSVAVPTPQQLQASLNQTLSQDGITIRLVDPKQTTNGAEGIADSGGLEITINHNFSVPFVNTGGLTNGAVQPCIPTQDIGSVPIPGLQGQQALGNVCLPAGNYTAVTSVVLGMATADVNASVVAPLSVPNSVGLGNTGLGNTGLGSLSSLGSTATLGSVSGPGTSGTAPTHLGGGLLKFPIRGVPAPLGWVVLGLILCVIFAYPLMLTARWQFLVGRR